MDSFFNTSRNFIFRIAVSSLAVAGCGRLVKKPSVTTPETTSTSTTTQTEVLSPVECKVKTQVLSADKKTCVDTLPTIIPESLSKQQQCEFDSSKIYIDGNCRDKVMFADTVYVSECTAVKHKHLFTHWSGRSDVNWVWNSAYTLSATFSQNDIYFTATDALIGKVDNPVDCSQEPIKYSYTYRVLNYDAHGGVFTVDVGNGEKGFLRASVIGNRLFLSGVTIAEFRQTTGPDGYHPSPALPENSLTITFAKSQADIGASSILLTK